MMQKSIWRAGLIVAMVVVLSPFPSGANEPLVSGVLSSPGGKGIANFPVIIQGEKEQFGNVAITDNDGKFWVQKLPAGKYSITPVNDPETVTEIEIKEIKPSWWQFWSESRLKPVKDIKIKARLTSPLSNLSPSSEVIEVGTGTTTY